MVTVGRVVSISYSQLQKANQINNNNDIYLILKQIYTSSHKQKTRNSTGIPNCIPFLQKEWDILIYSGSLVGK